MYLFFDSVCLSNSLRIVVFFDSNSSNEIIN